MGSALQLRFYPVSAEELLRLREDVPHGRHKLEIPDRSSVSPITRLSSKPTPERSPTSAAVNKPLSRRSARWEMAGISMDLDADIALNEHQQEIPDGHITIENPVACRFTR